VVSLHGFCFTGFKTGVQLLRLCLLCLFFLRCYFVTLYLIPILSLLLPVMSFLSRAFGGPARHLFFVFFFWRCTRMTLEQGFSHFGGLLAFHGRGEDWLRTNWVFFLAVEFFWVFFRRDRRNFLISFLSQTHDWMRCGGTKGKKGGTSRDWNVTDKRAQLTTKLVGHR